MTPSLYPAAPLDRTTKLTTAALIVGLVGLMLTVPVAEAGTAGLLLGIGVPVAGLILGYGYSPRAYRVWPDGRLDVVRRLFGAKHLRIQSAELTSALFGLGGIRLAGSGGAFGWYGLFWRRGTGRYRAYVTDRAQLVICDGPDGVIVLSPADRDGFVAAGPGA